jgi:hypothetical protein
VKMNRSLKAVTVFACLLLTAAEVRSDPFASVRSAMDCSAWVRLRGLTFSGTAKVDDLSQTFIERVDPLTGTYARFWRSHLGAIPGGQGFDGRLDWSTDRSGASHYLNSPAAIAIARTDAWLARRGWCGSMTGAHVAPRGARTEGGTAFDVYRVQPLGGAPVDVWIDARTHLLARTSQRLSETRIVQDYHDWRVVGGALIPFERDVTYPEDQESERWDAVRVSLAALPPGSFAPPPAPDDVVIHGRAAKIPFAIVRHKPRISVRINGRGPFTYVLDTGGHFIATPATARAASMQGIGEANETGAGTGILPVRFARANVTMGGATMRGQVAKIVPYSHERLAREGLPTTTGWLGLETFERFAVTLDPFRGVATFKRLRDAPVPHGVRLPIVFDEDAPLTACTIDGHPGECMIDTGNGGDVIVEGHWAEANGLARALSAGTPDRAGFYATHVTIVIGPFRFSREPAVYSAPAARGSESTTTVAAILSEDLLRRFVMTVDYGRGAVYLAPH